MNQYKALMQNHQIDTVTSTKLFNNESLTKQLITIIINHIRVGDDDIEFKLLE
jgi:hypothetical protein